MVLHFFSDNWQVQHPPMTSIDEPDVSIQPAGLDIHYVTEPNKKEFHANTPSPYIKSYDSADHFSYVIRSTVSIELLYVLNTKWMEFVLPHRYHRHRYLGNAFWFGDKGKQQQTKYVMTALHCVPEYLRYSFIRGAYVECRKYHPSLFKLKRRNIKGASFRHESNLVYDADQKKSIKSILISHYWKLPQVKRVRCLCNLQVKSI
eukprot:778305_1